MEGPPSREDRRDRAFCTVRSVAVRASTATYCANHYLDDTSPIGPMFGTFLDHERIPYLGSSYPHSCTATSCLLCGAASPAERGVQVKDADGGVREFCGPQHYVRWWKAAHPGERLKWDCDSC